MRGLGVAVVKHIVLGAGRLWAHHLTEVRVLVLVCILSTVSLSADRAGAMENNYWAYCGSWAVGTVSGMPLIFILFLQDLSSRSAILSFIHIILFLWALWASTSVLKDVECFFST